MPAAGVPARVAVPLWLSVNVTPAGSEPVLVIAGIGDPVVPTVNVPALPAVKVALFALVMVGAVPPPAATCMARSGPGVGKRLAGLRQEAPVVPRGMQGQRQHAEGGGVPDLAVRGDRREARIVRAAGADDELADPVRGVQRADRGLRREALVDVIVAVEDDVCVMGIEHLPHPVGVTGGPAPRAEEGDVEEGQGALIGVSVEIGGEPFPLRAVGGTATHRRALGVEGDEVPLTDVEAVVALGRISGRGTEVLVVAGGIRIRGVAPGARSGATIRQVFVVADRGVGDRLDAAPARRRTNR